MKKKQPSDAVLGVFVNTHRVEAALLRPSGGKYDVVGRFTRQRMGESERAKVGEFTTLLPGLKSTEDADFTIQIGDSGSAPESYEMFLSNEFAGLGAQTMEKTTVRTMQQRSAPFVHPLKEILAECRALGYEKPTLAFCASVPDVAYVELFATKDHLDGSGKKRQRARKNGTAKAPASVDRRRLLDLLSAQHKGNWDAPRVAFVPMTPLQGQQRYLAIVPEHNDAITATLTILRGKQKAQAPASRLLGSEVSLYTAMIRKVLPLKAQDNTAFVRIGSEDTLILFMTGTQLRHVERSRSLTSYDPLETICSRVLLQQDEQKIGDIHQVLVMSEGRNEALVDTFQRFYPHAVVDSIQDLLFQRGVNPTSGDEGLRPNSVPAIGIGLNLLQAWGDDDPFGAVNLLPKKLLKKVRRQMAFAWHTIAMLVVLFGVTLFFTGRYVQRQDEITLSRADLQFLEANTPVKASPEVMQARVDSLKRVYQQYTRALYVLDSLLIGSDQWSRTLEKTSRATRDLSGIWYESWHPEGLFIRIKGNAMERERVAHLANMLDGAIHETSFADINGTRIYPFTMIVPRPSGMPKVVDFLKDYAEVNGLPSTAGMGTTSAQGGSSAPIQPSSPQQN